MSDRKEAKKHFSGKSQICECRLQDVARQSVLQTSTCRCSAAPVDNLLFFTVILPPVCPACCGWQSCSRLATDDNNSNSFLKFCPASVLGADAAVFTSDVRLIPSAACFVFLRLPRRSRLFSSHPPLLDCAPRWHEAPVSVAEDRQVSACSLGLPGVVALTVCRRAEPCFSRVWEFKVELPQRV